MFLSFLKNHMAHLHCSGCFIIMCSGDSTVSGGEPEGNRAVVSSTERERKRERERETERQRERERESEIGRERES